MKHEFDEQSGIFTICPEGRIDSDNAAAVEQELVSLRKTYPEGRVVFDLDRLSYLSSAGLRIFLRLARKEKSRVSAVNASAEVMDIFRMTGFETIIDISQKMREVSVDGCEIIGRGANGVVYRLDPETVIKVFRPEVDLADVEKERKKSQAALVRGLPTAISYDVVRTGDCYGIVYEMINSKSLADVMREDETHFDRYAEAYISLYKEIHQTEGDIGTFDSSKAIYEEAIDFCSSEYTREELEKLRMLVRSVPDRETLIHGDFHPKNIMLIDGELILIDMGSMSVGHPVFDFLATAAAQVNLLKLDPAFASRFTGMPAQMITRLWNALLDGYFSGKDTKEIERINRRIAGFSKLKVALAPYFARDLDESVLRASIEDAKTNLLPVIDELMIWEG